VLKEKETENQFLIGKLDQQEDIIQNLQDKINRYEDKLSLINEYKINVKMLQNEIAKIKKEIESGSQLRQIKEIKSIETFSINRIVERDIKKVTRGEGFHYIENVNIYNDNKSEEISQLKAMITQSNLAIEQLKKKLNECLSLISYKDNQIKTLDNELISMTAANSKRERMIKTLHNTLAEKTKQLCSKHNVVKWTYILLSAILVCLLIFKTV
jgi:hypothetical protein